MPALAHLWDAFRIYGDISTRRLRQAAPAPLPASQKYVLFVDNRFPDYFAQIEFLFRSGFLDPRSATIVARYYVSSATGVLAGQKKYGFGLRFFTTLSTIPQPPEGSIVLYPYNGQANNRMMLNRESIHVFVGHGDSNKKASINPMLRAYDYVLVTGELQQQRLIDQHILRHSDLASNRMIALGHRLIDAHQAANLEPVPGNRADACIAYLPTWEGGFDRENYCSVGEANTERLLVGLARKLGVGRIVLDVHPNLGSRRADYAVKLAGMVESLLAQGLAVDVVRAENKEAAVKVLNPMLRSGRLGIACMPVKAAYAVVDVSATESIVAASRIPSVVAWRDAVPIFGSRLYWQIRRHQIVPLSDDEAIDGAAARALTAEDLHEQAQFAETLFNYHDPELAIMAAPEQGEWLHAYVHDLSAKEKARVIQGSAIVKPGFEPQEAGELVADLSLRRKSKC